MKIFSIFATFILFLFFENISISIACSERSNDCPSSNSDYFSAYGDTTCSGYHLRDGIQAQITFMSQAEMKEHFRPKYAGEDAKVSIDAFADVVKSLLNVIRMKQVFNLDSTLPEEKAHKYINSKVVEESCQWLNMAGLSIANDCSNMDTAKIEEIYARLSFYDSILNAKSSLLNVYPNMKHIHPIHMCAWMNSRILNNCDDLSTHNHTVEIRDTLNNMCGGQGRRRCDPQLCTPSL